MLPIQFCRLMGADQFMCLYFTMGLDAPQSSTANRKVYGLTRSAFVQLPVELLIAAKKRKGLVFVYGWLWHHAGKDDAAFPTIETLSDECGMKGDDVRLSLKFLVRSGWIERHERPGLTPVYRVRSEGIHQDHNPSPKWGTPPLNGGPLPQTGDPSPKWGTPPLPQMGGGNKKPLTRTKLKNQETPLCSPVSAGDDPDRRPAVSATPAQIDPQPVEKPVENLVLSTFLIDDSSFLNHERPETPLEASVSVQPQPQQPIPPWGQPRPLEAPSEAPVKKTRSTTKPPVFLPTDTDVPAGLLPVSKKIIAFWQHKAGKKTPQAWALLIQELTKIKDFVNGGLDAVSEQCDLGINAKINGKGWQSITLNNYIKMGGGSQPKTRQIYGRQDVLEKAHEASQIVKILQQKQQRQQEEYLAMMGGALPS